MEVGSRQEDYGYFFTEHIWAPCWLLRGLRALDVEDKKTCRKSRLLISGIGVWRCQVENVTE